MAVEVILKEAVMRALAVGGIADDRVSDVLEVAAQLMASACLGAERHQGVARGGVAIDRMGQLDRRQAGEASARWLRRRAITPGARIGLGGKGMIDEAAGRWPAAHHRQIALVHPLRLELLTEMAGGVGVEGEQQHPGGTLVEAMHRLNPAAELIAQQLDREAGFMAIDGTAVHQQPGGLVDGDQVLILIDDRERGLGSGQRDAAPAAGSLRPLSR